MRALTTRLALVLCLGGALSACASGARTGAMTPTLTPETVIADSSPLHNAIKVGSVSGGTETNPLWKSKVSDDNFRTALTQALELNTMVAGDSPRFVLNAELVSLDQPFAGLDMKVTATVRYRLIAQGSDRVLLDEPITTPYTAKFGDALVGMERLRLANEGAMRENISALIHKLVALSSAGQLAGS